MARHGGGAFSGKDPSKVDRSAAYAARYVAKNIVAAGLADRCEIQVSYAIGVAEPTSITVDTFGTGKVSQDAARAAGARALRPAPVRHHQDARPRPPDVPRHRGLRPLRPRARPHDLQVEGIHRRQAVEKSEAFTAFTWEKTDKAEALRKDAGL